VSTATDTLHFLPATRIADLAARGDLSPVELTELMLQRIADVDGELRSYTTVTADLARAQARRAEDELRQGRRRSPLHGVPVAVKDLCFTAGIRTSGGMVIHESFVPDHNATVVDRLERAGTILLGKLHMTEGAMLEHHPDLWEPRNPWRADLWTGVSSSGSGVATAAGLAFATVGSDTGGSIRFPSAANGLTGVKPTWGRVSRHGIFDLAATFDHLGPLARSAADAAAMLEVLAGHDPRDPTSLTSPVPRYLAGLAGIEGASGVRLAVDPAVLAEQTEPVTRRCIEDAIAVMVQLGASLRDVHVPDPEPLLELSMPMAMAETVAHHSSTYPAQAERYGAAAKAGLEWGMHASALDIGKGIIKRQEFRGALSAILDEIDALVVPVFGTGTPTWGEVRALVDSDMPALIRFTWPYNAAGVPTVTLPCGFTVDGRPVGMQLVGRHESEVMLLRLAHAYQQATDWHTRRPPVHASARQRG
jgi:amidase